MIKDPVFAEFDMEGRLWVCEFQSYMKDTDGSNDHDDSGAVGGCCCQSKHGDGASPVRYPKAQRRRGDAHELPGAT